MTPDEANLMSMMIITMTILMSLHQMKKEIMNKSIMKMKIMVKRFMSCGSNLPLKLRIYMFKG